MTIEAAWRYPGNPTYDLYGRRLVRRMTNLMRILPQDSWLVSFLFIPPDISRGLLLNYISLGGRVISPRFMTYRKFRAVAYAVGREIGLLPYWIPPPIRRLV